MENSQYRILESRRIKEIAKEYMAKGYEVILEPHPDNFPDFLKGYRPDIFAFKGDEKIIIEVKSSVSINKSEYMIELADKINQHEGWKFELILTNPKKRRIEHKIPSLASIQKRLESIYDLKSDNQRDAAFIISWATFEAATRHLLKLEQPKSEPELAPNALIKQLYSFGIIGKMNYNQLNKISKKRNEIVHGFFDDDNKEIEKDTQRLITIIEDIIKEIEEKLDTTKHSRQ